MLPEGVNAMQNPIPPEPAVVAGITSRCANQFFDDPETVTRSKDDKIFLINTASIPAVAQDFYAQEQAIVANKLARKLAKETVDEAMAQD
jgi:hypothetical protein